jgi:hypothetical protein
MLTIVLKYMLCGYVRKSMDPVKSISEKPCLARGGSHEEAKSMP